MPVSRPHAAPACAVHILWRRMPSSHAAQQPSLCNRGLGMQPAGARQTGRTNALVGAFSIDSLERCKGAPCSAQEHIKRPRAFERGSLPAQLRACTAADPPGTASSLRHDAGACMPSTRASAPRAPAPTHLKARSVPCCMHTYWLIWGSSCRLAWVSVVVERRSVQGLGRP